MERTPEQIKRIHVALEQAGNISGAASLLNVSADSLKKVIRDHPELRSYLPGTTAPTEQEVIGRKPLALVSVAESDIVKAVKDADEQVRSGFEAIGVSGDALKEAMAFRDFGRMHFNDMRHYIGGGMAKLFADLMVKFLNPGKMNQRHTQFPRATHQFFGNVEPILLLLLRVHAMPADHHR